MSVPCGLVSRSPYGPVSTAERPGYRDKPPSASHASAGHEFRRAPAKKARKRAPVLARAMIEPPGEAVGKPLEPSKSCWLCVSFAAGDTLATLGSLSQPISQFLPDNDRARDSKKRTVDVGLPLVTHAQAPEPVQPLHDVFRYPAHDA